MTTFRVNSINEIPTTKQWTTIATYDKVLLHDDNGNLVSNTYLGRKFLYFERKAYTFSKLERLQRGLKGVIATICTLIVGVFFIKSIRNLFIQKNKVVDFSIFLTEEQDRLIEDFKPEMIEAFGGVHKMMNVPKQKRTWGKHEYNFKQIISSPITILEDVTSLPTLFFCYATPDQRQVWEQLERETGRWRSMRHVCSESGQLHLGIPLGTVNNPSFIEDHSIEAKFMLDKIKRLVHGESVGVLKQFPNVDKVKPSDKDAYRPSDAYLQGMELDEYMDGKPLMYERMPKEGGTDVYLFHPKKSPEENLAEIQKKFPNTELKPLPPPPRKFGSFR